MNNNNNNNSNLNNSREAVNKNVTRYGMLGKTNRNTWNSKRSFRGY